MSQDCACCTTPAAVVPSDIQNRPWLPAIAYRIGTFTTFRKAILDQLSHTRELAALTARVPDDYTITAIELWSAVADVLTFYQERIANEAFLRTAIDRDSLLRLVRLIDYQLAPGSAATVELAFTLEAGANALIPARTRAQSVPAEGEKAQKFETLVALLARAALNRVRILPPPDAIQLAGQTIATPTSAGQRTAIVAPDPAAIAAATRLSRGDRVALYAPDALEVLTVQDVTPREDLLTVTWTSPIAGTGFAAAFNAEDPSRRALKMGRSFHLFGFDMPPRVVVPVTQIVSGLTHHFLKQLSPNFSLDGDGTAPDQIALDARYDGLRPGITVLGVAAVSGAVRAFPFLVTGAVEARVERKTLPAAAAPTPPPSTTGTVTRLTLVPLAGKTMTDLAVGTDIRSIVIHELVGEPLRFWPYTLEPSVMSGTLFVAGRRTGASTIEIDRKVEKGAYKPGAIVDAREFERGRRVLLSDVNAVAPVGGTIASSDIVGTQLEVEAAGTDPAVTQLGFAADHSARTTVIASRRLGSPVVFANPRRELTVQIGTLPPQTVVLSAASIGLGTLADVAHALQTAIRAAVPGAPTVARALVWVVDGALLAAAGIPGDAVTFGPSASDPDTVNTLGLGAAEVTYLDGIVTAPIAPLVGTPVAGAVKVTVGIVPPSERPITTTITGAASLASTLAAAFSFTGPTGESWQVTTQVTDDDRIIVLPPLSRRVVRTFVRLIVDLDDPVVLDAATAVLLGNVAPASHGETVANEVAGDGDGSQAFQKFPLKKRPVTYVPAAVPGGVSSSLEVFVNGVRWSEVPTLYGAGPRDAVYIARVGDDGTLTVQFGDGVTGSRLPSGRGNVVARYRSGTGLAGRVRAAAISSLLDRPTGVKNVTNLIASDGGAEPETMARARHAAPGTVRTFGRAVALRDFEDTALLAGEVAKAVATWVWTGERRVIHVTVAAQQGATFSAQGLARLRATLATERDPNHKLMLDNYAAVAVVIAATLHVDDRYVGEQVLGAARATLLNALSFERRQFAQPVYLSDIIAVLQGVEGVRFVDVDTLDVKSADPAFRLAHGVDPALGQPQPRLLILPARPAGSATAVLPAELAWVESPAQDVTLRAVGGITL